MTSLTTQSLKKSAPIGFLFLLTILFFYPVIFQDKTFYAFDTLLHYLPWSTSNPGFRANNTLITDPLNVFYLDRQWFSNAILNGSFSFWNDARFCGVKGIYPSNPLLYIFFLLFPITLGHDLMLWFCLFSTGLFTYLYLKEIKLRTYPSLIGAVSWMFNGYVMTWFEFEHPVIAALTFSASLFCIERRLSRGTKTAFLGLVCATALAASIEHPQLPVYQLLITGCYILYRFFFVKSGDQLPAVSSRRLLSLYTAMILGVCVSFNFVLSNISTTTSLENQSNRKHFTFDEIYDRTGQLPATYLTTFLYPDLYGSPTQSIAFTPKEKGAQPYNNYNEMCLYSGILTLFLTLVCLAVPHKKPALFFLITAVVILLMAMGSVLYYPVMKIIPGLDISTPTRVLYPLGFCLSVLAALGADILITLTGQRRKTICVLWTLLFCTALLIMFSVQTREGITWLTSHLNWSSDAKNLYAALTHYLTISSVIIWKPLLLISITFILLAAFLFTQNKRYRAILLSLLLLLLSYDLISFGLLYNTAASKELEFPSTGAIEFLQKDRSKFRIMSYGNFMHNALIPLGIEDAGGYSTFYPRSYGEYLHLSQYGPDVPFPDEFNRWIFFRGFGSPLLDLINVKYLLLPPEGSVTASNVSLVYDKEIKIYENKNVLPRIFFVPDSITISDRKEIYKTMSGFTRDDFLKQVILETPPPGFMEGAPTPGQEPQVSLNTTFHTPDRIEIEITADQKGFLVISDNFHPGWRASVDGDQTDLFRANYIMKAVPVDAGSHQVILTFDPGNEKNHLIITAIIWIILMGAIFVLAAKNVLTQNG